MIKLNQRFHFTARISAAEATANELRKRGHDVALVKVDDDVAVYDTEANPEQICQALLKVNAVTFRIAIPEYEKATSWRARRDGDG